MKHKKMVFINMGFDPTASLDIVSTLSLSSGDKVVVVYPRSVEESSRLRSEQARTQVKNYITTLRTLGRRIGYEELELNLGNLEDAVESLLDAVMSAKGGGYRVYFELTGGTRAITILMTLVAAWFADCVEEITFIVEVTRSRGSVPVVSPVQLGKNHTRRVLAVVSSRPAVRRREVCRLLGMSESSVSRAISQLKSLGIVEEKLRVVSLSERFNILRPIFRHLAADLADSCKTTGFLHDKANKAS